MLEQITSVCIYAISVALSLLLLVFLIAIGWLFVWKVFLSRFKFVRELVNGSSENVASPSGSRRSPPHRKSFGVSSALSPSEAASSTAAQGGSEDSAQSGGSVPTAGFSSRPSGQRRRPRID